MRSKLSCFFLTQLLYFLHGHDLTLTLCFCIVFAIESHRSDKNLRDVFESLFPGEIEHAEMLIDTSKLEGILQRRRALIEKYDNIDAKYRYECWLRKERESGQEPGRPMVSSMIRNDQIFDL
jgi:hypothetical protein